MKTKIILLNLMILICGNAVAQMHKVTMLEALSIAERQFPNRDVDYFLLEDTNQASWTFFVDAEPQKGWEHECYILKIPKTITTSVNSATPTSKMQRKLPPNDGNYIPLSVKNRYGDNSNSKPIVAKASLSNDAKSAAQRTYAIILNGGINKMSNYERYWNDCSFIYQTLVNKYGIPKENIFPIMSDGDNPNDDMLLISGKCTSQPLDLDNDNINEISLAATKANIQSTLDALKNKLNIDDHLFFYVIDHGGTTDYETNSYICLWNNEQLYDTELATMLQPFIKKYVNVNVILGQCFSGGFNDNLALSGCVVASACTGSEASWACPDIPYDEFVYQWTCAINGATHKNLKINADEDNNGRVSMQEAFEYAKKHDRKTSEHPQYISTPISIGEDLAFNNIAPAIDLYVKDNPEDTGKEPNLTTEKFWISPSIWVRNKADGIQEHENPYYSPDHVAVTVYVRVYNRGKKNYEGGNYYVHGYWAKASTGFRPYTWMGNEIYENGEVTGGPMTPSRIPSIRAGEYADVEITWALPADLLGSSSDNGTDKHHFCLLAKILDTHIEPWYTGTFSYDCLGSNKDAQKNVSIISKNELSSGTNVFIRNIYDSTQKYTLELIPRTQSDEAIYSHAKIEMEMSQQIYNAWERGGLKCNNINRTTSTSPRILEFTSKDSRIEAISLAGKEFDKVSLKFNFQSSPQIQRKYTLDLIQKDENGKIVGGETFIVETPSLISKPIIITPTPLEDGTSESGIERIQINDQNTDLTINLKSFGLANSSIAISSVISGNIVLKRDLNSDDNFISFDISTLNPGVYIVAYIQNGIIIDSVKFVK